MRTRETTAYLEKRRRLWYFVKEVPLPLRKYVKSPTGREMKRIVRSLGTDDKGEAAKRLPAAMAEFEAQMAVIRLQHAPTVKLQQSAAWHQAMQQRAMQHREQITRLTRRDASDIAVSPDAPVAAGTEAERALAIQDWIVDEEAEAIAEQHGKGAAEEFLQIVRSPAAAIEPLIEPFIAEEDIEARSAGDHRRALKALVAWAKETDRAPAVETFTRRVAGEYVTHLLSGDLDRAKTVSKRLWSLSSFWRYLDRKGHVEDGFNPWKGHSVGGGRSARDKVPERPFTADELHTLFNGQADSILAEIMRLAFFSGARIEELAMLKIKDIDAGNRTMSVMADPKTPASRRIVPVHPETWPIVERRIKGKNPFGFVLHELGPEPKEGRQRSMAVSKAFGRYRERVGVEDKAPGQRRSLVNFHSFRRTFVTLAEQAGIPESTIRSVVGHKREGMTFGVYSGGPSLEQRRACVESVKLPPVTRPQAAE